MPKLYAIEIVKRNFPLIGLLNNGVIPEIEKKKTYFIFDATWESEVANEIMTEKQLLKTYDIGKSPWVFRLKKA